MYGIQENALTQKHGWRPSQCCARKNSKCFISSQFPLLRYPSQTTFSARDTIPPEFLTQRRERGLRSRIWRTCWGGGGEDGYVPATCLLMANVSILNCGAHVGLAIPCVRQAPVMGGLLTVDEIPEWDDIVSAVFQSPEPYMCPICLSPPVAASVCRGSACCFSLPPIDSPHAICDAASPFSPSPSTAALASVALAARSALLRPACQACLAFTASLQMTRCGHIFCLLCVTRYLAHASAERRTMRRCPLCPETIARMVWGESKLRHLANGLPRHALASDYSLRPCRFLPREQDLRPVHVIHCPRHAVGDTMDFCLVRREKVRGCAGRAGSASWLVTQTHALNRAAISSLSHMQDSAIPQFVDLSTAPCVADSSSGSPTGGPLLAKVSMPVGLAFSYARQWSSQLP